MAIMLYKIKRRPKERLHKRELMIITGRSCHLILSMHCSMCRMQTVHRFS